MAKSNYRYMNYYPGAWAVVSAKTRDRISAMVSTEQEAKTLLYAYREVFELAH